MLEEGSRLFGTSTRTAVLVAIRLLEGTYPSELADLLGVRPFTVQSILTSLENEAIIVSRMMGRTRMVSLNPRYFAHAELNALLWKLGEHDTDLQTRLAARRRRPRRAGKPGLL
ncbi:MULTISPECIES: winged helix-turn-helix domain-containing protein [Corallococcus]|uniref:winged helix-turn-helix domain-containing protein n=1 Tax=Corallococcus TaxID=83461 RepID=UPI0011C38487|nr:MULTISPECIES: winged helix-turn-helix domain-containing protein [Corallococcus]NPD24796.1 winged helix-turn-helix transcriptional regulator [Corallococcus exiguus]NRD46527.1 winged helix-turn-helix transcriptional regulator [Corallococcus exiguus]